MKLFFNSAQKQLSDSDGKRFSPASRTWAAAEKGVATGVEISLKEAVIWLQTDSGFPCRIPVAVIGGRKADLAQLEMAEKIGADLAQMGLTLICGGRQGIMEAACMGANSKGGISVGILPDADPAKANPYVTVPIATGIGIARNAIIARSALCLIAIGGGFGTLSEIAFGLQFGKRVFVLADGPQIDGAHLCVTVSEAMDGVAHAVLALA